ncbi:MAG: aldehyde dehydrogenase [Acidobacteria bacterium]|nr:MAG: aldehyde dehydrogenase [Acidobacteriota bacterium]
MFQDIINPARFTEIIGQVRMCSDADVDEILEQAHAAFKTWSRTTPEERASRLREAARDLRRALSELATLFVRENGKPLREAEVDIRRSIELMDIVSSDLPEWSKPAILDPHQPVFARRRPRGVTAVISPWNSPVLLSFKRLVPAIATGNTVVVKPASHCPLTLTECVRLVNRFLPAGVLNVVTGSGGTVGEKLASDDRVRAVAFTGSTDTGRRIIELASRTVKKLFMELGGNDPALVLQDAILNQETLPKLTNAILRAAGQVCIAIKRIYVHESRYDELVEKLSNSFDQVIVGDGLARETTMGPLNNKAQFDFVAGLVDKCKKSGLTVLTKGRKLDPGGWHQGFFMLPAIILGAGEDHEIVQCEQFGPVVPIMAFSDDEDAVARANNSPYGLRASVWTRSRDRAQELADRLEAGAVFWNSHGIFQDLHIEFPGIKQSGFSRDSRSAALDHYADTYGFGQ